jgi:preprotein translocase subunit YajC
VRNPVAKRAGLCFLDCRFFWGRARRARLSIQKLQMMLAFVSILGQSPPPQGAAGGNLNFFVPLIFIFVIMYFIMIRPQKKRQDEQKKLVAALKTGDRVVTSAGIHGLISNVKEATVMLKVADNVKIEIEKSAVTNVLKTE